MGPTTKKWLASAAVTILLASVALSLGTASAGASLEYSLAYEGPRDAAAVAPLLLSKLSRVGGSGYGYGYGYGYGDGSPSPGAGYGYGYGYGYGGSGPRFTDLPPGEYELLGFADLDGSRNLSAMEPSGAARVHLRDGETATVRVVVREASSTVTGRVVSASGSPVAGATVTLTDAFGWTLAGRTGADGGFAVANAPTGHTYDLTYRIEVAADGFEPLDTGPTHAVTRGAYDAGTLVLAEVPQPPPPPPPADTTPPRVVSFEPTGAKVPPGKPIRIVFSEPMNRSSVEAALRVVPALAAPLKVEWEGNAIEVRGHRALQHGTRYAVEIASTASDLAGNALPATVAWSFTTAPGKPTEPPAQSCEEKMKQDDRAFFRAAGGDLKGFDWMDSKGFSDSFRASWCAGKRSLFPDFGKPLWSLRDGWLMGRDDDDREAPTIEEDDEESDKEGDDAPDAKGKGRGRENRGKASDDGDDSPKGKSKGRGPR